METLLVGAVIGSLIKFAIPPDNHKLPPSLPTTAVSIPHGDTSHITNTKDGLNHVYNVSFVNNNGHLAAPEPTVYEATQQYFKKTFQEMRLSDIASNIGQYCSENKCYILASAGLGTYMYMLYKLRVIQSYVDQPSWRNWKKDMPLDTLLAIPQDQLTHDLMLSIQERYVSIEKPTDSLTPLITFSQEIAKEKELLASYHSYVSWCTYCSLNKILPFSGTLLAQLTEQKQRTAYISTLFQSWLAHYKLEQIQHSRKVVDIPQLTPRD